MIAETQFKETTEDFGSKVLEIQKAFENFHFLQHEIKLNKKKMDDSWPFTFTVMEERCQIKPIYECYPCYGGGCSSCPHIRTINIVERQEVQVQKVCAEKEKLFREGQAGLSNSEGALSIQITKMVNLAKELSDISQKMKINSIIYEQYLEKTIKPKEDIKNPGWQARINSLKEMCGRDIQEHLQT